MSFLFFCTHCQRRALVRYTERGRTCAPSLAWFFSRALSLWLPRAMAGDYWGFLRFDGGQTFFAVLLVVIKIASLW